MSTMSWNEVVAIHNAQSGISTKDGKVRSVLCNQAKEGYADEVRGNAIFYRVTSSTNQKSVAALRGMAGLNQTIQVFEKLWMLTSDSHRPPDSMMRLPRMPLL